MKLGFSRIPKSVLMDEKLSDKAVRIYGILSGNTRKKTGSAIHPIGVRLLAKLAMCSVGTVSKEVNSLIERGHLKRLPGDNGQRAIYCMTSPVFAAAISSSETLWQGGSIKVVRDRRTA